MLAVYIGRRLAQSIVVLIGVTVITFVLFRVIPGDPALLMVDPRASPEDIEVIRHQLGIDQPLHMQYARWLQDLIRGDYGTSVRYGLPVMTLVLSRIPATIELIIVAVIIAIIAAILLSVLPMLKKGRATEGVNSTAQFIGLAIPMFLWALILVICFAVFVKIFPVSGRIDPFLSIETVTGFFLLDSLVSGDFAAFVSSIQHILLPSVSLAIGLSAMSVKTLTSSLYDIMQEEYILTDRSKGLSEKYIVFIRALRNALIPMITIAGVQTTFLLGGSIIIEMIFGWPGLGTLIYTAIQYKDLPLMQGIAVTYAILVIVINLATDLIYSLVNPKIRYG